MEGLDDIELIYREVPGYSSSDLPLKIGNNVDNVLTGTDPHPILLNAAAMNIKNDPDMFMVKGYRLGDTTEYVQDQYYINPKYLLKDDQGRVFVDENGNVFLNELGEEVWRNAEVLYKTYLARLVDNLIYEMLHSGRVVHMDMINLGASMKGSDHQLEDAVVNSVRQNPTEKQKHGKMFISKFIEEGQSNKATYVYSTVDNIYYIVRERDLPSSIKQSRTLEETITSDTTKDWVFFEDIKDAEGNVVRQGRPADINGIELKVKTPMSGGEVRVLMGGANFKSAQPSVIARRINENGDDKLVFETVHDVMGISTHNIHPDDLPTELRNYIETGQPTEITDPAAIVSNEQFIEDINRYNVRLSSVVEYQDEIGPAKLSKMMADTHSAYKYLTDLAEGSYETASGRESFSSQSLIDHADILDELALRKWGGIEPEGDKDWIKILLGFEKINGYWVENNAEPLTIGEAMFRLIPTEFYTVIRKELYTFLARPIIGGLSALTDAIFDSAGSEATTNIIRSLELNMELGLSVPNENFEILTIADAMIKLDNERAVVHGFDDMMLNSILHSPDSLRSIWKAATDAAGRDAQYYYESDEIIRNLLDDDYDLFFSKIIADSAFQDPVQYPWTKTGMEQIEKIKYYLETTEEAADELLYTVIENSEITKLGMLLYVLRENRNNNNDQIVNYFIDVLSDDEGLSGIDSIKNLISVTDPADKSANAKLINEILNAMFPEFRIDDLWKKLPKTVDELKSNNALDRLAVANFGDTAHRSSSYSTRFKLQIKKSRYSTPYSWAFPENFMFNWKSLFTWVSESKAYGTSFNGDDWKSVDDITDTFTIDAGTFTSEELFWRWLRGEDTGEWELKIADELLSGDKPIADLLFNHNNGILDQSNPYTKDGTIGNLEEGMQWTYGYVAMAILNTVTLLESHSRQGLVKLDDGVIKIDDKYTMEYFKDFVSSKVATGTWGGDVSDIDPEKFGEWFDEIVEVLDGTAMDEIWGYVPFDRNGEVFTFIKDLDIDTAMKWGDDTGWTTDPAKVFTYRYLFPSIIVFNMVKTWTKLRVLVDDGVLTEAQWNSLFTKDNILQSLSFSGVFSNFLHRIGIADWDPIKNMYQDSGGVPVNTQPQSLLEWIEANEKNRLEWFLDEPTEIVLREMVKALIKLSGKPGRWWWFWMPFYMSMALSSASFKLLGHEAIMAYMTISAIAKNVFEYLKKKNPWD